MAEKFQPKYFDINSINGGDKFVDGDGVTAEAINAPIEAAAYAQALAKNQPNIDFIAGEGEPSVLIENAENGTPRFRFENLKGKDGTLEGMQEIEKLQVDVANIQAVLQGNSQYAEITVSKAYESRVTANGANIFDNQLTPVESIKGSTVRCKNLANINAITGNNNIVNNGDGSITVNLTSDSTGATTGVKLSKLCPSLKVGDTVVFSATRSENAAGYMFLSPSNTTLLFITKTGSPTSYTQTITQEMLDSVVIVYGKAVGLTFTLSDLQIELGDTVTDYQPYFTGLKNANINSIVSTGKNLFDIDRIGNGNAGSFTVNGNNVLFNDKGLSTDFFAFSYWLDVVPNTTYYFSCASKSITSVYIYTDKLLGNLITRGDLHVGLNVGNNKKVLVGFYSIGRNRDGTIETISDISISTSLLDKYEPYVEHTYQLPQTVELGEFDTLYPEKGTIERFTNIFTDNGSSYWRMAGETGVYSYDLPLYPSPNQSAWVEAICNLFTYDGTKSNTDMTWYLSGGILTFVNKSCANVNEWIAYLSTQATNGNPLVLAYKTADVNIVEPFNAPQAYEVDKGGTETVVQGETDNSIYGAKTTITQTYLGKVGE